jgi:PAS domain S-box-containing protein
MTRCLLVTSVPQFDSIGQFVGTFGLFFDITESEHAQEALRQSEEQFRTLVQTSPDGVISTDLNGRFLFASERVREMYGSDRVEDLIGRNPLDFIAPEDHQRFLRNVVRTAREGVTRNIEYSFVRRDGTRMAGEISANAVKDTAGQPRALVAILRDITERKRAEEALRASEERYELAVRGAGVGIWDWDIRTGKLYFSPRWKMLFGYDENDIGDSVEDWARLLHPDEKDWMRNFLEDFLAGTSPTVTVEYRLRHKDGSYRWIVATGLVLRDEQGKAYRFVGSHGDITDHKEAQEALRQSHDELRAIYESLGDGLLVADRATLRLVRANAAICSMLGYSEEELLSMSIPALHPKEAVSDIVDLLQRGIVGHLPGKSEVPMLRKDGSVFYADISGDTFTFQGRPCSLGVFRDVTDRRQAHEALERERQTLWHMLQASDHERQTISYDIHDGLAQYLAAAGMQLQVFDGLRDSNPEEAKKAYNAATQLVHQSHAEARRLISEVRPPVIDEIGLETAISHLVHEQRRRGGPTIKFDSDVHFKRLPSIVENAMGPKLQEE